MKEERIVFMGTASFSLAVLKMLFEENYNIVGVVSQPDRYVGRKKILTMPDVKIEALKHNVPVIQPQRIKADYQDILDEILRLLIENGKALEINTAGLKAGLSWPNPHMEILKRYRSLGGELITIGSDAHRPEHMAFAFDRLPEILSEAGFSYYTLYREQKPYFISLES